MFAVVAVTLAVAACYFDSLHNPFVWDQEVAITGNPMIRSWRYLPDVFRTNVEGRRLSGVGFYRPMEVISYMADYSLWKLDPFGYHCSSILLHLCNSLLLLLLLWQIGLGGPAAFFASLLFAVHPVNSEAVTYSIRGDLLGALFSLLCFLSFLKFIASRRLMWGVLSVLVFLCALLSKESAVMLPLILLAFLLIFRGRYREGGGVGRGLGLAAVLLFISLIYGSVRIVFALQTAHKALSLISEATLLERVLTLPRILLTYVVLLIFPRHLHMEYHFVERSLANPYLWGFLLLLPVAGYAFFRWRSRFAGFFLIWFVAGLAPFYNIVITLHATFAEHWAYFAGMGFLAFLSVAGVGLFHRLKSRRWKWALVLGAALLFACDGLYTALRNLDWSDPMRLYRHDLRYEPNSFVLHNNVGVLYFREGDFAKAKEAFLNSIRVSPGGRYATAHNNLGVIYEGERNLDAAEVSFKRSVDLDQYELAYGNLSRLYLKRGRVKEAITTALEGKERYSLNPEIAYWLAVGYFMDGQLTHAREQFVDLMKIEPDYKEAQTFLQRIDELLRQ